MKDGNYLFIYSEVNPLHNALGISLRHDHNMAAFSFYKGQLELMFHCELERFSGIKHHNVAFYNSTEASNYINSLLKTYDMTLDDFEVVFGTPGIGKNNYDFEYLSIFDINNISHHSVFHLYSSMMLDTNKFYTNDIIALAFDGGPDSLIDRNVNKKNHFCGAISKKGHVQYFPISSPGAYWAYISSYLNIPEGTLMALAYATTAQSLEVFEDLPSYYGSRDKMNVSIALNYIINKIMNYTTSDEDVLFTNYDRRFTFLENKISMIVKIIQRQSVKSVCQQLDYLIDKYSIDTKNTLLSLSGGYALNCPSNTYLMGKYHFKELVCIPCVNDSGISIGMGLYFFFKKNGTFSFSFNTPFNGYSDHLHVHETTYKYRAFIESVEKTLTHAVDDIISNPIIWISGKSESGPRALGHRSLLADPSNIDHKNLLNKYKKREWWRPVAPIVLYGDHLEWFENSFESPYMLNNFYAKEEKGSSISAVLHLDNSARIQTIRELDDYDLFNVILQFKELTGIPMLCNTSLNDKGEPIINTLEEAINFGLRKGIKHLYAYGYRIILKNHDLYFSKEPLLRNNEVFFSHTNEKDQMLLSANPHGISYDDLLLYIYNPDLQSIDITRKDGSDKLKKVLDRMRKFGLINNGVK